MNIDIVLDSTVISLIIGIIVSSFGLVTTSNDKIQTLLSKIIVIVGYAIVIQLSLLFILILIKNLCSV